MIKDKEQQHEQAAAAADDDDDNTDNDMNINSISIWIVSLWNLDSGWRLLLESLTTSIIQWNLKSCPFGLIFLLFFQKGL